jgi:hypothetical protein
MIGCGVELPSSLREASWSEGNVDKVITVFEGNERRGNLPSLSNWQELFNSYKTSLLQF